MLRWLSICTFTLVGSATYAQLPDIPATPTASSAVPTASSSRTGLFSRVFSKTPESRALCRVRFANSPAGQLVNNLLKPLEGVTGGLLKPIGANEANPENLKKPADSAQGATAKIKLEMAAAKEKIADLEFLGTKNCKRYPEAEAALINGLRAEKEECVRLAAARALQKGCCCTPKVMKALLICVNGSKKDGNPAEDSPAVIAAARAALERCVMNCGNTAEEAPEKPAPSKPEGKEAKPPEEVTRAAYEEVDELAVLKESMRVIQKPMSNIIPSTQATSSNTVVELFQRTSAKPATPALLPKPTIQPQDRSLTGLIRQASGGR
jgi:hypothetical protein